jgi:anti-sigma B factor antagonist
MPASAPVQRLPEPTPLEPTDFPPIRHERTVDLARDRTVVAIGGDLDRDTGGTLRDVLVAAVDSSTSQVVIDLSEIDFVGSRALGTLVVAARRAYDQRRELHVVAAHPSVLRSMELTGLDRFLRVTARLADVPATTTVADGA